MVTLETERVADLEPIPLQGGVGFEGGFVGLLADDPVNRSLVRIDADGTVSDPVALDDSVTLMRFFTTSAGLFGLAYDYDSGACGYATVDPEQLQIGEITSLVDQGDLGCSIQPPRLTDGSTAVFAISLVGEPPVVAVLDTETGDVVRVSLADHADYSIGPMAIHDGAHFAILHPGFDPETEATKTAADGSELPELLVRMDPAYGELTDSTELAGGSTLGVQDGQLLASTYPDAETDAEGSTTLGPQVVLSVDPESLETTETDLESVCTGPANFGSQLIGGLNWNIFGDSMSATEPGRCEVVAMVEMTSVEGVEGTDGMGAETVLSSDGDDLLVLRVYTDGATGMVDPVAITLDRVTLG